VSPEGQPPHDPNRMSILEHLEELRSRLIRSAVAIAVGFCVGWYFSPQIYNFIAAPALTELPEGTRLAYTGISDPFLLYAKIALITGLFLASPYVLWQLWMFVSPGLYRKEKKWVIPFVTATTLFFFVGGAFGYYILVPLTCSYFISLGKEAGFQPVITVRELFSFELQMIMASGGVFEMPVLIFFLTRIGVVTHSFLWHYFGHAMFIIWLIAAWVTPSPDAFSMIVVGTPMTILYFISIGVSWLFRLRPVAP
jgi:sec-independent protein translocase protein TatC